MPVLLAMMGVVLAPGAHPAGATTIQDLVRIKGHERNTLIGLGIVVGLDGTGDTSRDSLAAARPYEQLLRNLGNPLDSVEELARADSYALVQVTLEIPATGTRAGDRLDVSVSTLFNATSLQGGELVISPVRLPLPGAADAPPLAFANGPVVIDGFNPRRGVVRDGGQMMIDVRANPFTSSGRIGLIIDDQYAGYPVAAMLARVINDEFALDGWDDLAAVEDAKNIQVAVPRLDGVTPAEFLANLLTISIDPSLLQTEARIVINEREGIILVTGDVQVGPVLITHEGLSITSVTPPPVATVDQPQTVTRGWAQVNTTEGQGRAATRLADLLRAFDQLNVPVRDQIAIVYELRKTGKLHAEILVQ
jgi:flagellar P-ring protein precursor FlgI